MDLTAENPMLLKGDCLEVMKTLPDKSVDLFLCDLPYGETNCKWDTQIDLEQFWKEFRRLRKTKKVACIHFCSTQFGYTLIKSWEKGFKMDMVWKKRNKTGGIQSKYRPMRNHEMVYFFYDQAPKYNRDKYHKRIKAVPKFENDYTNVYGNNKKDNTQGTNSFDPPNPASVLDEQPDLYGEKLSSRQRRRKEKGSGGAYEHDPPNPASVIEQDDEPVSMYESKKVFIGKRNHQTEKPQDILEFFLKYWSDEGDTVLDPTMGSGSTGVACKKLKRNFVGIELTDKYYEVAQKRIGSPQN